MATVLIIHAASDGQLCEDIIDALETKRVADTIKTLIPAHLGSLEMAALTHEFDSAANADCVVLVWSRALARSDAVQQALKIAIHAWSADRLAIAVPDKEPLPPGLRDLEASLVRQGVQKGSMLESMPRPETRPEDIDFLVNMIEGRLRTIGLRARVAKATPPDVGRPNEPPAASPRSTEPPPASARSLRVGWFSMVFLAIIVVLAAAGWLASGLSRPESSSLGTHPTTSELRMLMFAALVLAILTSIWLVWRRTAARGRTQAAAPPVADGTSLPVTAASGSIPSSHQVFISYSRHDATRVQSVVKQIEAAGYRVWIDTSQTEGAQRYGGQIVRAIRASKVVALMCSKHAFQSDHVVREVYVAGDEKKSFVAVQLDETAVRMTLCIF